MIELTRDPTTNTRDALELEPLFAVTAQNPAGDVERTEYSHPVRYPPAVGLRYIHLTRTQGSGPAVDWLLGWALGADGHRAVTDPFTDLDDDLCEQIVGAVIDRALGRDRAPKSGS